MHACLVASVMSDSATLWAMAHQAPLSRQEYWSEFLCPPPGDLPSSGTEPLSHVSCISRPVLYPGGFLGGSVGEESTCNAGDLGSVPGLGRSSGEGNGYPLQHAGLENSMGPQRDCATFTFTSLPMVLPGTPCEAQARGLKDLQDVRGLPGCACAGCAHSLSHVRLLVSSSPPRSSVHGIFQEKILEWVAISQRAPPDPGIEPASPALAGGFFTGSEVLGFVQVSASHLFLLCMAAL